MVEYSTIFFWLGGVLTEPLDKLTASVLAPEVKGRDDVHIWQELRIHADELALGQINPVEYCSMAAAITGSSLTTESVERHLLKYLVPCNEVISIIDSFKEKYDCRLIANLPDSWVKEIIEAYTPQFPFPPEHVDFLSQLNISQIIPDMFVALPKSVNRKIENCLMVDGYSHRAVEAVKSGFSSIIYVTPARLKHELALQGIFVAENEVLHPQSSERVEL